MSITSVTFRMYNTGSVGDCLLLLFKNGEKVTFKMMIDCGGWNADTATITDCVKDIRTTCKGELDLLVVTHQHLDHVSGFNQAKAEFEKIKVKQVWMSWIENKADDIAQILKDKYGKKLKQLTRNTALALKGIQERRAKAPTGGKSGLDSKEARMLCAMELLKLETGEIETGPVRKARGAKAAGGKLTNEDAMTFVKAMTKSLKYKKPGDVIDDMPGAENVKFFILGPPRDKDMKYFKIDMEEDEMYHLAMKAATEEKETEEEPMKMADMIFNNDIALEDYRSPFRDEYKMTGAERAKFNKYYNSRQMIPRQIETDWLETDVGIALRVNRLTNNTSLAMAIEFAPDKVILLPGDAQSGNWLGWHKPDVKKKLKDKGGKDTDDLLNMTIFYKVGHHGSHNGTASHSGLEKMKSEDLVAMMPLVQSKIPDGWGGPKNFPAGPLYEHLITKTQGRIIRTDEGIATKATAARMRDKLKVKQQKEFSSSFVKGPCYMEYTIKA